MAAPGVTGDLYSKPDDPTSTLGPTPAPPMPPAQPVTVAAPAVVKKRMADENPDGSVRDTSAEAIQRNDLRFQRVDEPPSTTPAAAPEKPVTPTPKETAGAPPADAKPTGKPQADTATAPATPEAPAKLYAGKFRTPEELERGYEEAQRAMHKAFEEKAALERAALTHAAAPTPTAAPVADVAEANKILETFITDPKKFLDDHYAAASQRTQVALAAQAVTNDWRKENSDLAENEYYVAAEANRLMQTDPELAKNPAALIQKATANFRAVTGRIRTEGAREALTQETRVIPLVSSTAPSTATEQPAKAPLTSDEAFTLHMKMLKEQEQRSHRPLRR